MKIVGKYALILCLWSFLAGGTIAWASIEDIWGMPLTIRELMDELPSALFDEIPIQDWDTSVAWCEEGLCAIPVETADGLWAGVPVSILVGSAMEVLLGPVTLDVGFAMLSEEPRQDELQDEVPAISETLSVKDVAIVQGYTMTEPRGFSLPTMAIVVFLERDGEIVDSLGRCTADADELSIAASVHDGAWGQAFAFHWIELPASCILKEVFVITRAKPFGLGQP